jgi:hypothetical protein
MSIMRDAKSSLVESLVESLGESLDETLDESLVAMLVGSCGAWRSTIAGPPRIACALSGRKTHRANESLKLDSRAEYRLLTTFCPAVSK